MFQNSLSQQLDNTSRQHSNAVLLSNAYLEALTSQKDEVAINLANADGTTSPVVVKTNSLIWSELERLRTSLLNVTGLSKDRQNTLVSIDDKSSFREIFVQNFARSYSKAKADEITFDSSIKTETNSIVESLLSPLTTVEAELAERFLEASQVRVTKINISNGDFNVFSNGQTYSSVIQTLATNVHTYKKVEYLINTEKRSTRFYGEFDVLKQTIQADSSILVQSNTLKYSDKLNVVEGSRELVVGNKLVSTDGSTRWNVQSIDIQNNTFTIKAEAGYSPLLSGVGTLSILSVEGVERRKVRVPVKLNEKSIIFISPVNKGTDAEAPFSEAKIFDSNNYTVAVGNNTFQFNEYFASKVADIGAYFEAVVRESAIPANLGETPEIPIIQNEFFNIVQINKHLTNTPETEKLKKLQSDYEKTNTEITVLNNAISNLNSRIARGNYSSTIQKSKDTSTLSTKIKTKAEKSAYIASITTDIKTSLLNTSSRSITPKYRVRGFWPIQDDIVSEFTNPQKIVQYEVRYRYVANNKTTTDADQMSYTDKNGNDVNAVFTPWTYIKTEPRSKYKSASGEFIWSDNDVSSAEQSNINQLDIPIQYGENVEVQIRAISEAGYPVAPLTSTWSKLVQIKFPTALLQESTIASIARENTEALRKVELSEEFKTQGITEHVSTAVREQGNYYAHDTRQIASGFRTNEQTIISLFDFLTTQRNEIDKLTAIVDRRYAIITPQILDTSARVNEVAKFSKIDLFAGYYTDTININEPSNFGSIVTKVFYLRFNNKNTQTVEMVSISPGTLTSNTQNVMYDNVPVSILGTDGKPTLQRNGQIFYARNKDISGSEDFYINDVSRSINTIPVSDIDNTAPQAAKNVVHLQGTSFELVKISKNASLEDYVAVSTSHPAYLSYVSDFSATTQLTEEFKRVQQYNQTYKADKVQNEYSDNRAVEYISDDKYLVGKNSVGARLFPQFNQISSIQVNGIDTSSALQIHAGDSNSVIVPIVFQYRMTDAVGHVDGSSNLTVNSNFEYTKSIGIDLIVQGETFKFDVNVSAKFRPTSISNNNIGIQTTQNIDSSASATPALS